MESMNQLLTETELSSLPEEQRETYEWMIGHIRKIEGPNGEVYYPKVQFGHYILITTCEDMMLYIYPDGTFN